MLVLCLLPGFAGAAEWFVAVDGDNAAAGTLTAPLRTLSEAALRAEPNDTVYIREGVYRETLAPRHSGLPGQPITFTRFGAESAVIDASGRLQGVMLWNVSNIVVRGLEIRNAERVGVHIHHHQDVPSMGSDGNVIENNQIHNNRSHGVYVGGNGNRILNNSIFNNGESGPERKGHGIYVLGKDNQVAYNNVHHNQRLGIRMAGERQKIEHNWVEANGEDGIGVWVDRPYRGASLVFESNQLLGNGGNGIHISGFGDGEKPESIVIRGNTIQADGKSGLVLKGGVSNVQLSENKLLGRFLHFVEVDGASTTRVNSDHNHFQGQGRFYFADREFPSLQDYQQGSGQDGASVHVN